MILYWQPAPLKIQFGAGMVISDIALTKDNTLTIYCEETMIPLVEKMFSNLPEYEQNRTT